MRVWVVVEVVGAIFHGEDVGASAGDGFLVEGDGAVEGAFGDVAPSADKVVNIGIPSDSIMHEYGL